MTKELKPDAFYTIIERFKVCKNLSEKFGRSFKRIFTSALVFVIAFVFFIYIALRHEENSLLNASDELCHTISIQLAFSASIPITPERGFLKRILILRQHLKDLRDQDARGLVYAGLND